MTLDATKRLNWLKYQYPGTTELQTEQNWHHQKRIRHKLNEHYPGVVNGLTVEATSPASLNVTVKAGRAIGADGNEIVISSDQTVGLASYASGGGTAYIVAYYSTTGTNPYVVPETGVSQNMYTKDTPVVGHQAAPASGTQIELARVIVTNGAASIGDPADPNAPGNNEIDMRSRAVVGRPHEVVLFPDDGNLETQLAYVQRGYEYWLMPGAWTLGANLTIDVSDVKIRGSRQAIVSMGSYKITTSADDILIEGVTLRSSTASATNPIVEIASARAVLRDVLIDKTGSYDRIYGISLISGCSDALIEGCDIDKVASDNAGATQIRCDGGSGGTGCRIVGCRITVDENGANTEYGIKCDAVTDNPGLQIIGCTLTMAASATVQKIGVYAGTKWLVSECRFYGGSDGYQQGIEVSSSAEHVTVTGSSFHNLCLVSGGEGVVHIEGDHCNIVGCSFTGSITAAAVYGVRVNGDHCSTVGCFIDISCSGASGAVGIASAGGTGNTISDNTVVVVGTNASGTCIGIQATSGAYTSVVGNTVKCTSAYIGYGIDAGDSNSEYTGNTVECVGSVAATTSYAVYFNAEAGSSLTGNILSTSVSNTQVVVYVYAVSQSSIIGNVMKAGTGGTGNEIGIGFYTGNSNSVTVMGNSIFQGITTDYSIYVDTGVTITKCHFIGNIFNGAGTANGDGMTISGTATFSTAGASNNNRAHNANSTANNN